MGGLGCSAHQVLDQLIPIFSTIERGDGGCEDEVAGLFQNVRLHSYGHTHIGFVPFIYELFSSAHASIVHIRGNHSKILLHDLNVGVFVLAFLQQGHN